MARGAVRRVTEGLIVLTVMITVGLVGVRLHDDRILFAAPIAAMFVQLILKHGGEAINDTRKMIILIGLFAFLAVCLAAILLDNLNLMAGAPVAGVLVWLLLFLLLWPQKKADD